MALAHGTTQPQLEQLALWPHGVVDVFDVKQNTAFGWAQAVTLLAPVTPWTKLRAATLCQFSECELANLSISIAAINAWNRLAIAHQFE